MRLNAKLKVAIALAAAAVVAMPATAQATTYQGPNGPKDVRGAIEQEWLRLNSIPGGFRPGQPLNDETPTPVKPGAFNNFQNAAIYWSPNTGAHEVHGSFYGFWGGQGWENGRLGFPTTNEQPASGGVFQSYQGATLYWSPWTGPHSVSGEFYTAWDAKNWERGPLGFPAGEPAPAADGGTFQRFAGGAIYDEGRYDDAVTVSGAFYGYWAAQGYERGRLGYPWFEEDSYGSGDTRVVSQLFAGGTLYWSARTGSVTEYYPS
jgi:uncharacterized protein with LGFP repeats